MVMFLAYSAPAVRAHFIWLVPAKSAVGTTTISVRFGEDASDDSTDYLSMVKGVRLHQIKGGAPGEELKVDVSDDGISAVAALGDTTVVVASHDFGVMDRGDSVFRLQYYAKTGPALTSAAWQKAKAADDIRLDIVPVLEAGKVRVHVQFDGKPVAGVQVKAAGPGMDEIEAETNGKGVASFKVAEPGVYSIRARHVEDTAGEVKGKKYPETRHYTTVAVEVPTSGPSVVAANLQALPQPVTSFGAAVVKDSLYMYGGHTGSAHSYSKEEQGNQLIRLDLQSGKWSTLVEGPPLQGLALVTHGGKLYRIGGFTAENAEGEEHKLVSQSAVAMFDPAKGAWEDLPSLPEPRSSHDAAVVGDAIYVVGGWAMGGEESVWHDTAWKMDLTKDELRWEPIAAPPFKRRALALAAHNEGLYVVGGMQDEGGPTTAVAVYDPAADKWSEGPSLFVKPAPDSKDGEQPRRRMSGGAMTGFGASAFATGGALYVTTVQGDLQKLAADGKSWEVVSDGLTPRFFHRLLPLDSNHLIVVGGSNMSIGKFEEVEVIDVRRGT